PTVRSSSRPNISGPSLTNRSPTAALTPSRASTRRSATAASPSPSSQTPSAIVPSSTGGHVSVQGRNQPESVLYGKQAMHRWPFDSGTQPSRQGKPLWRSMARPIVRGLAHTSGVTAAASRPRPPLRQSLHTLHADTVEGPRDRRPVTLINSFARPKLQRLPPGSPAA